MKSKFTEQYVKNHIRLARNYWTAHQSEKALNILKKLTKKTNSKLMLAEVQWLIGKIYEEEKKIPYSCNAFRKSKIFDQSKTRRII